MDSSALILFSIVALFGWVMWELIAPTFKE